MGSNCKANIDKFLSQVCIYW